MPNTPPLGAAEGSTYLDTIAQLSTSGKMTPAQLAEYAARFEPEAIRARLIPDNHDERERMLWRAHARRLSVSLANALAEYRTTEGYCSPLRKSYLQTLDCCTSVSVWRTPSAPLELWPARADLEVKARARFCKQRWCVVCARNAVGKFMAQYGDVIDGMLEPHFVTLTVRNVIACELRGTIEQMVKRFRAILQSRLGRTMQVAGLRKIECTYSEPRDDYHPHLHLIVDHYHGAEFLLEQWLNVWGEAAHWRAQDVQRVKRNGEGKAAKELFKYYAKMFDYLPAEEHLGRAPKQCDVVPARIAALDTMYQAMKRYRQIQPFGGVKRIESPKPPAWSDEMVQDAVIYHWSDGAKNWVEGITRDRLGRKISRKMTPEQARLAFLDVVAEHRAYVASKQVSSKPQKK